MIKRRDVLYGIGSLVFLPYLESLYAQENSPIKRAIIVFSPNGMNMDDWNLKDNNTTINSLSPTLSCLEPFKNNITVFSGLAQTKARANGDGGGDHARSMSTFLTGVQIKKTDGNNITAGISADQIAANYFRNYTRIPSLQVGCESSKTAGNCDSGYSCAYSSTVSWSGPHTPIPKDHNPSSIFNTIFGDGTINVDKINSRRSVLDYSLEQANDLRKQLSGTDKRKLDEYLNSVREIERRLNLEKTIPKEPDNQRVIYNSIPEKFSDYTKLLIDLIVLSFQTDSTRIATLVLGNEGSNRSYQEIGVSEGHHELSHHQNNKEKLEKLTKINKLHTKQVSYLFHRLKTLGLLEETIVAYGCGIEDGNSHKHHDLPIIIGGGKISGGTHKIFPKETPLNNLWLGLLQYLDIEPQIKNLGDSTDTIVLC